jgi:hypothetical protein
MSWPAPVQAGEASTANQYNALLENLQTWGGDVDAGGYALTNLGVLAVAGAVTFTSPEKVKFGSDWQTYTPAITASGAMTISALTVFLAQYLRRGAECLLQLNFTLTLGGTLDTYLYLTLPVPSANLAAPQVAAASVVSPGAGWIPTTCWLDNVNKRLVFAMPASALFKAGVNQGMISLSYRVS